MQYENKIFVGDTNTQLTSQEALTLNGNIKVQKKLLKDEDVSAVIYSNLDAIKQGLEKGGINLEKKILQMGNTPDQIAKTFLNAVNFTINFDLPKQTGNSNFKKLFLTGNHEVTQTVVKNVEKLLNNAIPEDAIEQGVIHYKGHVNYHNHVKTKELEIKVKDGKEAQIKFVKENLDEHIGIINRLKEIKSEAKVFFQNFGKNVLNEMTTTRIKEDLVNLMKLPVYTLTYGIGGESGVMKAEVLKEKAKNTIQNLWDKTVEYVQDINSVSLKTENQSSSLKELVENVKNIKRDFSNNPTISNPIVVNKLKM